MSNTTKYKDGPKRSVFKTIPKNVEIVQKRQFFGNFQFIHVIFFRFTPFLIVGLHRNVGLYRLKRSRTPTAQ